MKRNGMWTTSRGKQDLMVSRDSTKTSRYYYSSVCIPPTAATDMPACRTKSNWFNCDIVWMGTSLQRIFRSILTTKAREWHGSEPTNIKHPRARRGSSLNNLSLAGDIRKVKFDDAFNADGLHGLVSFGMSHHSVGVCYVTYVFTFKNVFPPCQAAGRSAPIVADGRTPLQWRTLIFPRTFYKSSGCSSSSLFSTQQMIRQLEPGN